MATNRRKNAGRFRDRMRGLREDQLVQVASHLLLHKGCHDLRVDDVVAACGVAKGTCYQHFRARPDLIAAAVRYLDEALARRLLSPSPRLAKPHELFEWALLEAVDAEILTLTQGTRQPGLSSEALVGKAWPCCLDRMRCPYGGAVRSTRALRQWTTGLVSRRDARASVYMTLLLAMPPYYFFGKGFHGKPNPRTIRATARQLFKRLFR